MHDKDNPLIATGVFEGKIAILGPHPLVPDDRKLGSNLAKCPHKATLQRRPSFDEKPSSSISALQSMPPSPQQQNDQPPTTDFTSTTAPPEFVPSATKAKCYACGIRGDACNSTGNPALRCGPCIQQNIPRESYLTVWSKLLLGPTDKSRSRNG